MPITVEVSCDITEIVTKDCWGTEISLMYTPDELAEVIIGLQRAHMLMTAWTDARDAEQYNVNSFEQGPDNPHNIQPWELKP